ncbi:MAG: dehypoxanthine futalosine cyclase, partial [Peptococcaceae bacterium]|nr:dehypoxanthine futalosine cyclase [Peptococcaceae bacterium]
MSDIKPILKKAVLGGRLSFTEGAALFAANDLLALGEAANQVRKRIHPQETVTYIIDRNINYTNICGCECRFCAFWRKPDHEEAYIITQKELFNKIEETIEANGTAIMLQGGLHPELDLDYYTNMLRSIKERYKIHIHSFSPPEIIHIARQSRHTPQ